MWVRSQNKKILMEIRQVEISKYNNIIIGFNSHFETLGSYSTKEKALKVLDMIQETIIQNETVYAHKFGGSSVRDYDVFQMPADEEV